MTFVARAEGLISCVQSKKEDGRLYRKFVARIDGLEEDLRESSGKNSALAYSVKILQDQLAEAECVLHTTCRPRPAEHSPLPILVDTTYGADCAAVLRMIAIDASAIHCYAGSSL